MMTAETDWPCSVAEAIGLQTALQFLVAILAFTPIGVRIVGRAGQNEGARPIGHHRAAGHVHITGTVRAEERSVGGHELAVTGVQIIGPATDYPITPKDHGTSFLMENRHLWLRSSRQHAILKVRHEIIKAVRDFYDNNGYTLVDTPILTPASCEGTTTLFELDYFGEKAYLSQSGQLYNEAACMSVGKTYCFGPTFRAEKSKTRRHLMEFWMVEPEVAWADLNDIMKLSEDFVSYVVARVLENRQEELKILERDTSMLESIIPPFPKISYDEAFDILEKEGTETPRGSDFGGGDETVISNKFERPVIIHRYPSEIKAFYMQPDPDNPLLEPRSWWQTLPRQPTSDPKEKRRRGARATRLIRLLRAHRLLKKVPRSHRYQITDRGKEIAAAVVTSQEATVQQLAAA